METYESVKSNPVQPEKKEKKKGGASIGRTRGCNQKNN